MSHSGIRIVTAASLFDGHDASINIMRRILQDKGAEVIHLGHNRSVQEVVKAILQEGAQGVAISSYQGGHMEYFKYMKDLLRAHGADYVKIFGGGGGVIIKEEKAELEAYGIDQIFHPDDGRRLGLEGMIDMIIDSCDYKIEDFAKPCVPKRGELFDLGSLPQRDLGLALTEVEAEVAHKNSSKSIGQNFREEALKNFSSVSGNEEVKNVPILGITGTGGAGKSSLIDELLHRFYFLRPDIKIAVVCVDPSKRKTGGGLLGDRIRMNALTQPGIFMRSVASRGSGNELSGSLEGVLDYLKKMPFDLIIAESSGIGQASAAITEVADKSLYVMTSEFGAPSQLEKIDMIDFADLIAINKSDRRGSEDAFREVKKQYKRSRKLFHSDKPVPVYLTQASHFNDRGVNDLFYSVIDCMHEFTGSCEKIWTLSEADRKKLIGSEEQTIVPPDRQSYLAEIVKTVRSYKAETKKLQSVAEKAQALEVLKESFSGDVNLGDEFQKEKEDLFEVLPGLNDWEKNKVSYDQKEFVYKVRGKDVTQPLVQESLSGLQIPRVSFPRLTGWSDRVRFLREENVPGYFPYTGGVFPLKRQGEDPTRQFAGEGPPERTNKRFHYLSEGEEAKRLSTAFDSVTLYGNDPHPRPDIFGKVGESGVSIATLDDMKRLYEGFDLCDPKTSVSMTINGPAPMILAFFLNTAIDQQLEKKQKELGRDLSLEEQKTISEEAVQKVRGTVQADILKEDQGQNTCIFSIEFALKMMGDIQQYFIDKKVRNFYSVSISGYHIAEAGANPITQLALTLSNAFTYVEYYMSRGMDVDAFAPNLSFFFSNGLDPEYAVIGRVARRIWAVTMRDLYGANKRSQKLKYHIQTSGRSLHAQEIQFNDIRTTLQALVAVVDHCNSLHTNAYDEAITTPTEESVRRAQAIQLIINKEFGWTKNENSSQGSYFVEWLTDAVEEAVLKEFMRLHDRGGVLGSMETQYQRGKIQDESLYYETLKHNGEFPIVGVNTFVADSEGQEEVSIELARASKEEKDLQLNRVKDFQNENSKYATDALSDLKHAALSGGNIFEALMKASRVCSLFQMTQALFEVGGQYRRNI